MDKKEEIILDIIPIYKNKMYPTKDMIWHTKIKLEQNEDKTKQIKYSFNDYDKLIILKEGIVIEIL